MGYGIGLFSDLFHVTLINQIMDSFILMESLILIA